MDRTAITAEQAETALNSLPPIPDGAQPIGRRTRDADHAELYELVCSDFVYRMPTLHMAQAHVAGGGTTYLYEFCFDASPIGAAHTTEIPLVFGTLDSPIGSALYGSAPRAEAVSREMSTAWRAFATDGDPGWPAYERRPTAHPRLRRAVPHHALSGAGVTTDLGEAPVRPFHVASDLTASDRVCTRHTAHRWQFAVARASVSWVAAATWARGTTRH